MSNALQALAEYVLALADNELILAHRDSEWTGHAPILEEDIAFTNIALDEMGHASVWYSVHASLVGADPESYPDQLVFQRDVADFRCVPLVELPNGDWAFSMLRQYLFDVAEKARLESLLSSGYPSMAQAAAKIRTEEAYHVRHTRAWVIRLGHGTAESKRRMQLALDSLWPYALGLFEPLDAEAEAVEAGLAPASGELRQAWESETRTALDAAGLAAPNVSEPVMGNRRGHTDHLAPLLTELQSVARADPLAAW